MCLVSPPNESAGEAGRPFRRLAGLLATRHEVTVIHSSQAAADRAAGSGSRFREVFANPGADLAGMAFASEDHRRSACVLEAIERAYGSQGPDYVEVPDCRASGLVSLLARRGGNPLLRETLFAVRLTGSAELTGLHDGIPAGPEMRLRCDLEREQLRLADWVIWPGGDVAGLYRRHYPVSLPRAVRIGMPFDAPAEAPPCEPRDPGEPLRILFAGGFQRSRGALDLAEACLRLPRDDWRLTMAGVDTETAPGGQSVWLTIETMFGDDPRVAMEEPGSCAEQESRLAEHDLIVVPPTFEIWPEAALEAMRAGLPILATPVGGLAEALEPGVTGWLTDDVGAAAIRRSLVRLLERRDELERVRASGKSFERFLRLTDPEAVLTGYERLMEPADPPVARGPGRNPDASEGPLVTGVVPYYRCSDHVEEAVGSLLEQTHPNMEVVVVNDGSFEESDDVLLRLADNPDVRIVTTLNRGDAAARNLGACLARGEYIAMLDGDNVLEADFVSRALDVFYAEPELAYVSCWLRFIAADGSSFSDPAGYAPLGNSVVRDDIHNWDGDTLALLPRRIFAELGYCFDRAGAIYADWELYRVMRKDGLFGTVIPERLARYRVRPDSIMRAHGVKMQRRSWDESRGRRVLRGGRWTEGG
jgi:glycogen synthase